MFQKPQRYFPVAWHQTGIKQIVLVAWKFSITHSTIRNVYTQTGTDCKGWRGHSHRVTKCLVTNINFGCAQYFLTLSQGYHPTAFNCVSWKNIKWISLVKLLRKSFKWQNQTFYSCLNILILSEYSKVWPALSPLCPYNSYPLYRSVGSGLDD